MTMDVHHHRNVTAASSSPPSSRYSPPTAIEMAQQVTSLPTAAAVHQRPQKRSFDVAFLMAPDDLSKRRPRPQPPPQPPTAPLQPVVRSAFTKVHSPDPAKLSPGSSPPLDFAGYLHQPLQHHHLQKQYQHHHHHHQQQQQQTQQRVQQECSLSPPLPSATAAHFMSPFPLGFRTPFAMMMPPRPQPAKEYPLQQQHQQQLPSPSPLQFGPAAAAAAAVAALPAMLLPASIAAAALTLPSQNVCAKCNVSFRMTSDLVYHMRSHHKGDGAGGGSGAAGVTGGTGLDNKKRRDADKLRCPVCDESFRERHHLTRHMTAHQDKEGDRLDDEDDAPPPPPPTALSPMAHQQGAK